jgi:hypothetical protein
MLATKARKVAASLAVVAMIATGITSTAFAGSGHHRHRRSAIPQHNGGDHDSDNNGGPSDGDGNI